LLVLAKPKLVARLLASDFPSENPRTQTRNFPYTSTLATITEMTKSIIILTFLFLIFSCKENKKVDNPKPESQSDISKMEQIKSVQKSETKPHPLIKETSGEKTEKEYTLGNIKIQLNQYKSDGTEFYCKSEIVTYKNEEQLDYINFEPEPVGGYYGISKATKFNKHLIFTKHGDYDGRTIIINDKGKIHNIIGGTNYLDEVSELLFTGYESDLSGFAVFDLKTDSSLFKMEDLDERPISFHKNFGNRYFISCINDLTGKKSIWEIEIDLERIMQVELNNTDINSKNELKNISDKEIYCACEK